MLLLTNPNKYIFEFYLKINLFLSSIAFGANIIIWGGYNEKRSFNDYHVFNTTSSTWWKIDTHGCIPSLREKATLTKVTQDILVHFGGYAFGGDRGKEQNFNDLSILNLATMDWKNIEVEGELPAPRSSHTANAYRSSLYIFGGVFRQNSKARFNKQIWFFRRQNFIIF